MNLFVILWNWVCQNVTIFHKYELLSLGKNGSKGRGYINEKSNPGII